MSRHHKTGNLPAKDKKKMAEERLMMETFVLLDPKEQKAMSEAATILLFTFQYAIVWFEDFVDKHKHNKSGFMIQLLAKANAAIRVCENFINHFEPLVSTKDEWNADYGLFQLVLDNWYNLDQPSYMKDSDAPRAKEICRAAALRYLDPLNTVPRKIFEEGFCKGAAYADLHPYGYMDIKVGEKKEKKTYEELAEYYAYHEMLKGEKQ